MQETFRGPLPAGTLSDYQAPLFGGEVRTHTGLAILEGADIPHVQSRVVTNDHFLAAAVNCTPRTLYTSCNG